MSDPPHKFKNYVLTLWLHMTERCWEEILAEMIEDETLVFAAYGAETCPDTGTLHYQAYVSFKSQRSVKSVRKMFEGNYVNPMAGSFKQNEAYCSKEGQFTKLGHEPSPGQRNDILEFKSELDLGKRPLEIAEEEKYFPVFMKYSRALKEYAHHVRGKRMRLDRTQPKVYIRIGESGSGKTKWLDEQFGLDGWARMPNPTGNWWITESVSNSDTVLIDELGPSKAPKIEEFLEWTDRYPIEFNSKGGHLWWKPKNIVITSNCSWTEWWPSISEEHKAAVARRIHRIDLVYKDRPEEHFYPNGNASDEESQNQCPPQGGTQIQEEEDHASDCSETD